MVQWDQGVHLLHLCQGAHSVQQVPKKLHDITMLEYFAAVQTFKNMDLLISFCGTYSGACRSWATYCTLVTSGTLKERKMNVSEDFKRFRKLHNQTQIKKHGDHGETRFPFPLISPLSHTNYHFK